MGVDVNSETRASLLERAPDAVRHEPDELCCAVCMQLLCEPILWPAVQPSACAHTFCRLCTYQVLRWNLCNASTSEAAPRCPICRVPATEDTIYASPESLAVERAVQQRVLQVCDAAEYQARLQANHAVVEQMTALEFDLPLHAVGRFQLRKGQKIKLRLPWEQVGAVAHALVFARRRVGLVLSNLPYVGVPARMATLCGFRIDRPYTMSEALAQLSWKMVQDRSKMLEIEVTVGPELFILSPPYERSIAPRRCLSVEGAAAIDTTKALDIWVATVRKEAKDPRAAHSSNRSPLAASCLRVVRGFAWRIGLQGA